MDKIYLQASLKFLKLTMLLLLFVTVVAVGSRIAGQRSVFFIFTTAGVCSVFRLLVLHYNVVVVFFFFLFFLFFFLFMGPVVQSVVSLRSSLRVISLTILAD